ncbi:Cytidylyltransferase [Paucidesulfovibrio gracilis DSM 16080]|uniref:Cytidylyltransferase n=1 Tax=Paucidesulfovibrio gracilis DSM 16080 TaxID=1121449 RepID=A0A1T4X2B6_9BACT|nr:hypothetical protein [Paucidesulfovibrio gracilis]SKA83722.1 Cytidylyltransferase [Paucidesulfovibrio gracilis DSM 16080]
MPRHIAVIPARMGSKGFKFKNRKFFCFTADFLDTVEWFDRVIVSTDDPVVEEYARERGHEVHQRPQALAGSAVPIHAVFESVIAGMDIHPDDYLWLFYLPVLYKSRRHFEHARGIVESGRCDSLCTFVPARSHPYNCWRRDPDSGKMVQYIENDCFRRQDLPDAWVHYHYVYSFRAGALPTLNSEMINADTHPYFLDETTRDRLIEIDEPEDYERWKAAGYPTGDHDD